MFNLLYTMFVEIFGSISLTSGLKFMSLIVVLMLLSSPGVAATILLLGGKLGILSHVREQRKKD